MGPVGVAQTYRPRPNPSPEGEGLELRRDGSDVVPTPSNPVEGDCPLSP